MARLVVIGSLNMDLVACAPRLPVTGETLVGHTYFDEPGGKGANQAYAAARLEGSVAMLGRVGDDEFGRRMRDNLRQAGCSVTGILTLPGCVSGIAVIFVADTGENTIIIVPGANDRFTGADVMAQAGELADARVVLLQLENPLPTVVAAARAAHAAGARVILDPAPAQPLPHELWATLDIVTPNETEAAILAGLPPGRLTPAEAAPLARQLQQRGARHVIVKLGDQGCLLAEAGAAPRHLPAPQVAAVDSTAAGDIFNAALGVALAEGQELAAACGFANAAAALSVTRRGAQACAPTRAEVAQMLNARSSVRPRG